MRLPQEPNAKAAQDSKWAAWIRLIAKGDEASLAALYDAAVGFVHSVALRITRCPDTAEDVTINVFYQVWRTAGSFDASRGSPHTWLFVICRTQSLALLRSADRAICYCDTDAMVDGGIEPENDPQSLLMAVQKNTSLHLALQTLSPLHRELLTLAFFRGLTYSEIACLLKLPLGTVKTKIRRAIQMLRSDAQLMERAGRLEKKIAGKHESL